jgi:fatty aldehyde-generating acyl-ACP reductase
MDNQPAGVKFALMGHQDSWETVRQFVNTLRVVDVHGELSVEKIREVYTYMPSRKLFDISVSSAVSPSINGAYIETFISPDELDEAHLRKNISKVKEACMLAAKMGARIVSLGGFTSIVLEADNDFFSNIDNTYFTTGNTLTAAFVADGIEKACHHWNVEIAQSTMLIIGSTGDIGSACVKYFSGKVKQLLLCARQPGRLKKQSVELSEKNIAHIASTTLKELIAKADIVISVASSMINADDFIHLPKHAIVCDAGYPKNLRNIYLKNHERLFYGGMGVAKHGFEFGKNAHEILYRFPVQNVAHGCMLEAIVLAMEENYCAFSKGRGNITETAMQEIKAMAAKHGIVTAPLFNDHYISETSLKKQTYEW